MRPLNLNEMDIGTGACKKKHINLAQGYNDQDLSMILVGHFLRLFLFTPARGRDPSRGQ